MRFACARILTSFIFITIFRRSASCQVPACQRASFNWRHRTTRAKGCLSHETGMIMVFKLIQAAQSSWRRLDGQNQLPKVIEGVKFTDGIEANRNRAAA
jgi:hypothetical protein